MKEKRGYFIKVWSLFFIFGIIIMLCMTILAKAFYEYEVTPENSFQIIVKQKRASSSTGTKYSTGGWYLFKEKIEAATRTTTKEGIPINAAYYDKYGFKLTTSTQNRVHRTEEDKQGVFYDTFQFDAEKIVPAVLLWYTEEGVIDRDSLIQGVTVYASRSLNVVVNGKKKSTHYHYADIAKQASWSSGTLNAFRDSYDQPITLQFNAVDFSIEVVDNEGNIPEGYENINYNHIPSQLLYGESVTYEYPGEILGYEYVGLEWRVGSSIGNPLQVLTKEKTTGNYTITYKEEIEQNGLVLVFRYEKIMPPTQTPLPTNTPTAIPEPTLAVGVSATPTPLPTNTPTPLPTATPIPTNLPTKDTYANHSKKYYFSTDEGYTISKIIQNTSYELSSESSPTGAGNLSTSTYTKRENSYLKGIDEKGNEWYFVPDGTNAIYVHPAVYAGYRVDSEEVKYITELIFPSVLFYDGNSYRVVSIGGGTAKYKSTKDGDTESWNDTTGFGYYKKYNYGIEKGFYDYYRYNGTADNSYTVEWNNQISYAYGVLGNGKIESVGGNCYSYRNGVIKEKYFDRVYHVYNTTLQSVTIPSSVIIILPYAFYGCQALTEIKGGENVKNIRAYSFQAINPILIYSSEWVENSIRNYDMYYYNESFSMIRGIYTDTMINWNNACKLSAYLRLPKLPVLDSIGEYAFERRNNLFDVVLSDTVSEIDNYAFQDCELDSITIPRKDTKIKTKSYTTLGTNLEEENRTIIYTVPNSKAMEYGLLYFDYYRLKSGYPVIYESNGSGEAAKTYASDVIMEEGTMSFVTTIYGSMFSREGYQFIGWNTKPDGSGVDYLPKQEVVLEESLTLYAQWKQSNHIVRYDKNGGFGTMADTILAPDKTSTVLSSNQFVKKGYEFIGWNTKQDGTGTFYADGALVSEIFGTLILYAQWEKITTSYTLLYMKYPYGTVGNMIWKQKTLMYDSVETIECAPFETTGNKVAYDLNVSSNASTIPEPLYLTEKNTTTSAPFFDKWHLYKANSVGILNYQGKQYKAGAMISALTTEAGAVYYLYPKWEESGASVILPITTCVGYYLEGWNECSDGSGSMYYAYGEESEEEIGTFAPLKDTILYAIWTPEKKTIALDGQLADIQLQKEVVMTFDALLPTIKIPERKQYVFQGYYTEKEGKGIKVIDKDGTGCLVTNDTNGCFHEIDTLYAYWLPDRQIVYHPNYSPLDNDCKEMEVTWVDFDSSGAYLSKNAFVKKGYHFTNWNTKADGTGTSYQDGQYVDGITTKVVLYAQWEKNTYNVHYATDVYENNPEILEREDDIWFYDNHYVIKEQPYIKQDRVTYSLNNENKSTVAYMITELTQIHTTSIYPFVGYRLYEKTIAGYERTEKIFQAGEIVHNLTAQEGKVFVLFPEWEQQSKGVVLPKADMMGYIFGGWVRNALETESKNVLQSPYITKKNITLYAFWTPKQYHINLNDRGATSTQHSKTVTLIFDKKGETIQVPTKTGYTFQGYYTEPRGVGTKYYDKDGICIKEWTEDSQDMLYAYWIQNKIEFPKEDNKIEPEVLPSLEYKGEIGRTDEKVLLYADDYNDTTGAINDLQPYLTHQNGKIPSTEQLAIRAKMGTWILSYHIRRISEKEYVRIYVTVPYRTQYEKEDETLVISEQKKKTYEVIVPKVYSYWEVVESGLYYPKSVTIQNEALNDGQKEVIVQSINSEEQHLPKYQVSVYEKEEHAFWETVDFDGKGRLEIILTEEQYIISDVIGTEPEIDKYLSIVCENTAWKDERKRNVRNDLFVFDGKILISDMIQTTGTGCEIDILAFPTENTLIEQTNYEQTYETGIDMKDTIPNGTYQTKAWIRYVGDEKNIGVTSEKIREVFDVNSLQIHTPIACKGILVDEIEGEILDLKETLNFFSLIVSNVGTHLSCLGYGTKDFSMALSGASNIAMDKGNYLNQVKFPFDVFCDVAGDTRESGEMKDDLFITAGTWITLGKEKVWFYIPVTQKNGVYHLEFRSIAVNCPKNNSGEYITQGITEQRVNLDSTNYIATDMVELAIQSYIEDFEIIDTNDKEALQKLKKGIQALNLKKGYMFSYRLLTKGMFYNEEAEVEIIPSYYWVSEDEKEREKVLLYQYDVQAQSPNQILHSFNMQLLPVTYCSICGVVSKGEDVVSCGHSGSSIEISKWQERAEQEWQGTFYLPSDIVCVAIDTIQGYCKQCRETKYVSGGKNFCNICQTVLTKQIPFNYEQYCLTQTWNGQEEFFKKNGYIVVSFDIRIKSNQGEWYIFTEWKETKLAKDALAMGWNYVEGDVIRYELSRSIKEDYEVGGIE